MESLNTHNMNTLHGTVLRTSSPRIRNYTDSDGETGTGRKLRLSHAVPQHICTAQFITQPQKLHSHFLWPVTAVMYQVAGLTCGFVYGMDRRPAGVIHNNLAGDTQHMLFFQVRPMNQPTIMSVNLCHRKAGCPWVTETHIIRYQPFVLIHNSRFHSECYTNDRGSNKTC